MDPRRALYRCTIAACARWESQHIVEWLTYYASIGFDHIYLYCNDDDPSSLYRKVLPFLSGPHPFVTFCHYPLQGEQRKMYEHFLTNFAHDSEWIAFFDIDEFLYISRERSVNDLVREFDGRADVIYFNWLMFGNNGFVLRPDGDVLELYNRHEARLHPYTKLLVRVDTIDLPTVLSSPASFWHEWPDARPHVRHCNVLGATMQQYYVGFPSKAAAYVQQDGMIEQMMAEAIVCHFSLKSEEDFERRVNRGLSGQFFMQTAWLEEKQKGRHRNILDSFNAVQFDGLRDHWRRIHSRRSIPSPAPVLGTNIAEGKTAQQSSVSAWSRHQDTATDARGAVSGYVTGGYQFHTDIEEQPWWQVDLGAPFLVRAVRLFNRLDMGRDRARRLEVSVSLDGAVWTTVLRRDEDTDFGGADGYPLVVTIEPVTAVRYVRVTLLGRQFLHLDQVEVYT